MKAITILQMQASPLHFPKQKMGLLRQSPEAGQLL